MSHPDYDKIGRADERVIEECSELIHAISKARRFGIDNFHPQKLNSNRELILLEMADVERAIERYRKEIKPKADEGEGQ